MDDKIINIYVTFLNYNPSKAKDDIVIKNDGFCFLNLEELQRHKKFRRQQRNHVEPNIYKHYKWYYSILNYELNSAPEGYKLRVNQFEIESNNIEAFCLNGDVFTAVTIIFGPEMEYWYYSAPEDESNRICGSKLLEKKRGMFGKLNIIELKQRQLRPEPNDEILNIISKAYSHEPSVIAITEPPYFACRYEQSLDCLDEICRCNNSYKFETMLSKAEEIRCINLLELLKGEADDEVK